MFSNSGLRILMLLGLSSAPLGLASPIDEMADMFAFSFPSNNCKVENLTVEGASPERRLTVELESLQYKGSISFLETAEISTFELETGELTAGVPYWRVVGEFNNAGDFNNKFIPKKLDWTVNLETKANLDFLLKGEKEEQEVVINCSESE